MADSDSKACPICCETIKAHAKKCPHCHQWQGKLHTTIMHPIYGSLLVLAPIFVLAGGLALMLEKSLSRPERLDFAPYKKQIVVLESRFDYDENSEVPAVATIGKIKNNSPFPWENIVLEVQYFDKNGTLIDTAAGRQFTNPVSAGSEMGFAIRSRANRTKASYESHQVFVRSAIDPNRSFFP